MPSNNDDAFHFLFVQRASDALARGANPLDFWTPQLELGFASFVHYQNLAHLAVVGLHRALLGVVDLFTLFNLIRYLLLVLFPLTVLWSLRRMGFTFAQAALGAAASSLLATPFLYGLDYASYIWRGFGTYTQLWAMHLAFISLAAAHTVITRGRGHVLAILALAALVLVHLLYAYMLAITIGVLFVVSLRRASWRSQVLGMGAVGLVVLVITSYMWLPYLQTAAYLNVSPYLQPEKYDGLGAAQVLRYLVTGELFDGGRLPMLSLFVGIGIVSVAFQRTRLAITALVLFIVWLVLYFGRPTLGGFIDLLPLHQTLFIHRFSGAVHLAGILLIGLGAGWLWDLVVRRSRRPWVPLALAAAAFIALVPAMQERYAFYVQNLDWMQQTRVAIGSDGDAKSIIDQLRTLPAGRVFAGLRTDYGPAMNFAIPFNSVRFSDVLTFNAIETVSPPYNSLSLSSDMLWDFDYRRAEDYDLFNVRYVVAPATLPVPSFLSAVRKTASYTLYQAPTSGYGEYVTVTRRQAIASSGDLVRANRPWLLDAARSQRGFTQWDYPAVATQGDLPASGCTKGVVSDVRLAAERLDLATSCDSAGTLLIKVTYDPGWRVTVDGSTVATFILSPAYLGAVLPAGTHSVTAQYIGAPAKMPLFVVGLAVLAGLALVSLARVRRLWRTLQAQWSQQRRRPDQVAPRSPHSPT